MSTTYAVLITEENIPTIVKDAAKWKLNVDYLDASLEEAEEFGVTVYAILSVNYELRYATFTEMWNVDFENSWRFTGGTHGIWKTVALKKDRA